MAETVSINYEGVAPWLLCRRMLPEDHHRRLRGESLSQRMASPQPPIALHSLLLRVAILLQESSSM